MPESSPRWTPGKATARSLAAGAILLSAAVLLGAGCRLPQPRLADFIKGERFAEFDLRTGEGLKQSWMTYSRDDQGRIKDGRISYNWNWNQDPARGVTFYYPPGSTPDKAPVTPTAVALDIYTWGKIESFWLGGILCAQRVPPENDIGAAARAIGLELRDAYAVFTGEWGRVRTRDWLYATSAPGIFIQVREFDWVPRVTLGSLIRVNDESAFFARLGAERLDAVRGRMRARIARGDFATAWGDLALLPPPERKRERALLVNAEVSDARAGLERVEASWPKSTLEERYGAMLDTLAAARASRVLEIALEPTLVSRRERLRARALRDLAAASDAAEADGRLATAAALHLIAERLAGISTTPTAAFAEDEQPLSRTVKEMERSLDEIYIMPKWGQEKEASALDALDAIRQMSGLRFEMDRSFAEYATARKVRSLHNGSLRSLLGRVQLAAPFELELDPAAGVYRVRIEKVSQAIQDTPAAGVTLGDALALASSRPREALSPRERARALLARLAVQVTPALDRTSATARVLDSLYAVGGPLAPTRAFAGLAGLSRGAPADLERLARRSSRALVRIEGDVPGGPLEQAERSENLVRRYRVLVSVPDPWYEELQARRAFLSWSAQGAPASGAGSGAKIPAYDPNNPLYHKDVQVHRSSSVKGYEWVGTERQETASGAVARRFEEQRASGGFRALESLSRKQPDIREDMRIRDYAQRYLRAKANPTGATTQTLEEPYTHGWQMWKGTLVRRVVLRLGGQARSLPEQTHPVDWKLPKYEAGRAHPARNDWRTDAGVRADVQTILDESIRAAAGEALTAWLAAALDAHAAAAKSVDEAARRDERALAALFLDPGSTTIGGASWLPRTVGGWAGAFSFPTPPASPSPEPHAEDWTLCAIVPGTEVPGGCCQSNPGARRGFESYFNARVGSIANGKQALICNHCRKVQRLPVKEIPVFIMPKGGHQNIFDNFEYNFPFYRAWRAQQRKTGQPK